MNFKKGDRVRLIKPSRHKLVPVGTLGTVVEVDGESFSVKWDSYTVNSLFDPSTTHKLKRCKS